MSQEIWMALIAIIAAPAGAWIGSILLRKKYEVEIDSLKADAKGSELDNVREGVKILMEQIVAPLKVEIKNLRTDVNRFRRAIEKIPACPHSADCPVAAQLQSDEKSNGQQTEYPEQYRPEDHILTGGSAVPGSVPDDNAKDRGDRSNRRAGRDGNRGVRYDPADGLRNGNSAPKVKNDRGAAAHQSGEQEYGD